MMNKIILPGLISIVVAVSGFSATSSASGGNGNIKVDAPSAESRPSMENLLFELIKTQADSSKVEAVNQIAQLDTPRSKIVLKEYLRSLYSPEKGATSNLRACTINALFKGMDDSERKRATSDLFRLELAIIQKDKRNYVVQEHDAINVLTSYLERDGIPDDIFKQISALAGDSSVSEGVRVLFKSSIVKRMIEKDPQSDDLKIEAILEKMPLREYIVVPWDIYNVKQKRVIYNNTERQNRVKLFFQSENGYVLYKAYFNELLRYRLKAIEQILFVLDSKKHQSVRSDFLAQVGVELLVRLMSDDPTEVEREKINIFLRRLEKYVADMEDKGAGCYRNNAIRNLYAYYAREGMTNHPVFKEGGNVFATIDRFGEDDQALTNEVRIIELKPTRNKSESYPRRWIYGLCVTVIFSICALACLHRLRKK